MKNVLLIQEIFLWNLNFKWISVGLSHNWIHLIDACEWITSIAVPLREGDKQMERCELCALIFDRIAVQMRNKMQEKQKEARKIFSTIPFIDWISKMYYIFFATNGKCIGAQLNSNGIWNGTIIRSVYSPSTLSFHFQSTLEWNKTLHKLQVYYKFLHVLILGIVFLDAQKKIKQRY